MMLTLRLLPNDVVEVVALQAAHGGGRHVDVASLVGTVGLVLGLDPRHHLLVAVAGVQLLGARADGDTERREGLG